MSNSISTVHKEFDFFKELYKIMNTHNIHRIYRISYQNHKIIEASQVLKSNIGKNIVTDKIFDLLITYFPYIYFNIFYKINIIKYRKKLKKIFKKYNIETIGTSSFSLEQGIYTTDNKLCIKGVNIINKLGVKYHIDNLDLIIN